MQLGLDFVLIYYMELNSIYLFIYLIKYYIALLFIQIYTE